MSKICFGPDCLANEVKVVLTGYYGLNCVNLNGYIDACIQDTITEPLFNFPSDRSAKKHAFVVWCMCCDPYAGNLGLGFGKGLVQLCIIFHQLDNFFKERTSIEALQW